jgi:large conductance mechanosensitive channel
MIKEFREFALRGNVIDMGVGIIIGAAFGKIVTSFVSDILMPPIGMLMGRMDFSNLYIGLSPGEFASLAEAKTAGAATLNYGLFLNNVIDFAFVAFALFLLIRWVNKLKGPAPAPAPSGPPPKECPECLSMIPAAAKRCMHCTSVV